MLYMFMSVLRQIAQQKMSQLLGNQERLSRLQGAPRASLQTLAAMLASAGQGQQPPALQEAAVQDTWQSGTRDALRYGSWPRSLSSVQS